MTNGSVNQRRILLAVVAVAGLGVSGCTQQTPKTFEFIPEKEGFSVGQEIEVQEQFDRITTETVTTERKMPVDMLWVVDNSASMDVSQDRLRKGFSAFAKKYMKAEWDIRAAVLTTDAYLANSDFSEYVSAARKKRVSVWGPDYAKLLPGIHDGPIPAYCVKDHAYFFLGATQCSIRDQSHQKGAESCLSPDEKSGQTSVTQCVNTVNNNTVHSGTPIVSTIPPEGTPADEAWEKRIHDEFLINLSVSTSGGGSERAFGSVLQFLTDNETSEATQLFRPNSLRVLIFVADEDDQTMRTDLAVDVLEPFTGYTSDCAEKTVDGYKYRLTSCPRPELLVPVSEIKAKLDGHFLKLDGKAKEEASPNYFVASIIGLQGKTLEALHRERAVNNSMVDASATKDISVDRGDRFLELNELVGNGSMAVDIAEEDYSKVLDDIGLKIVEKTTRTHVTPETRLVKKSTVAPPRFTLKRQPRAAEQVRITLIHADGSREAIGPAQFSLSGKAVVLTDSALIARIQTSDRIEIAYQPKTVN